MSFVLPSSLPRHVRPIVVDLVRWAKEQARLSEAIEWTGAAQPSEEVPFRWHIRRSGRASLEVIIDPCQGKVFRFGVELPEPGCECELCQPEGV